MKPTAVMFSIVVCSLSLTTDAIAAQKASLVAARTNLALDNTAAVPVAVGAGPTADPDPLLRPGALVRVTRLELKPELVGRVLRVDAEQLVLEVETRTIELRRSAIDRLDVSLGQSTRAKPGALLGALIGALGGWTLSALNSLDTIYCDLCNRNTNYHFERNMAVGALGGAVMGAAWGDGIKHEEWTPVATRQRVGLGLAPMRHHGISASVSIGF